MLTSLVLACVLGAACAPTPAELPTTAASVIPQATATPSLHAPEVRIALIGDVTDANVWALFDSQGYSYNNYAVRSAYWPRLYQLSIPDEQFEPQAAAGLPSPVQAEAGMFASTVPLRSDLTWTDGSPFTAQDVAFTVNTAVGFQLGFDWQAYYDPAWLDHAAAIDSHTVKFYFKRAPTVAIWQYGALQGPVVQEHYWEAKIKEAAALLPAAGSAAEIANLTQRLAEAQKRVDALVQGATTATGDEARQLQLELQRRQGDLDEARNDLSKAHARVDDAMQAARHALYSLEAEEEPTLGTWIPAGRRNGVWVNEANPAHPFGQPSFDRATYALYPDQAKAISAIEKGDADSLLGPRALSTPPRASVPVTINPTSSAHFLVINPSNTALADPAIRRAMFCAIDRTKLAATLTAAPLTSFVPYLGGPWSNPAGTVSCGDGYNPLNGFDPSRAVAILKTAGYTWSAEPTGEDAGAGLKMPDGHPFPPVALLAPSAGTDSQSNQAAHVVQHDVGYLGVPLSVQSVDPADVRFALFNDRTYDVAIAGWRLSAYPGYLCDWFGDGNPFGYQDDQLRTGCQGLASTSDLDVAHRQVAQIELLLAEDPPFIPLYSGLTYDVQEGIRYPFDGILDGLSGVYGAPGLALPATP